MKYLLFTGTTCKACPQMKRNLAEVGIKYDEMNVDVAENWARAGECHVKMLPTLVLMHEGQPLTSFVGVRPVRELVQILERYGK